MNQALYKFLSGNFYYSKVIFLIQKQEIDSFLLKNMQSKEKRKNNDLLYD